MDADSNDTVSLPVRFGTVALMCAIALVASDLVGPNPSVSGVLISVVTAPIFPIGLVFLLRTPGSGGGTTDVAALLACAIPYAIYAAVFALAIKVKSMSSFVLVCLLLAAVLALNVKGCEAVGQTRWVTS